ncbi:uncharacterized protein LOC144050692 isoform X2 [Vanacampus margaritifer]
MCVCVLCAATHDRKVRVVHNSGPGLLKSSQRRRAERIRYLRRAGFCAFCGAKPEGERRVGVALYAAERQGSMRQRRRRAGGVEQEQEHGGGPGWQRYCAGGRLAILNHKTEHTETSYLLQRSVWLLPSGMTSYCIRIPLKVIADGTRELAAIHPAMGHRLKRTQMFTSWSGVVYWTPPSKTNKTRGLSPGTVSGSRRLPYTGKQSLSIQPEMSRLICNQSMWYVDLGKYRQTWYAIN